jgi:DHHC palmitoyltransferase
MDTGLKDAGQVDHDGDKSDTNVLDDDEPVAMTAAKRMEAFEIEIGCPTNDAPPENVSGGLPGTRSFDDDEEGFNDMENLLGGDKRKNNQSNATASTGSAGDTSTRLCGCFLVKPEMTMGNVQVPSLYVYGYTGGWGVVGPHWFGPPCVVGIIVVATYYFAYHQSFRKHWYWTAAFCYYLSLQSMYFLLSAAYRDPGIVREGRLNVPNPIPRSFRWCEMCNYHQPPTTLHCPDCNTCVLGFDHHCVWMGNCIGVGA